MGEGSEGGRDMGEVPVEEGVGESSGEGSKKRQRDEEEVDVGKAVEAGRHSDVVMITAGGVKVYAHSSVMRDKCPAFGSLPVTANPTPGETVMELDLGTLTSTAVQAVLSYMYTGEIPKRMPGPGSIHMMKAASDVVDVATLFGLQALRDSMITSCYKLLRMELNKSNNSSSSNKKMMTCVIAFFSNAVCSFRRLQSTLERKMLNSVWKHIVVAWWSVAQPEHVLAFCRKSLAAYLDRTNDFPARYRTQAEWVRFRLIFLWSASCISKELMLLADNALPDVPDCQVLQPHVNDHVHILTRQAYFEQLVKYTPYIAVHLRPWLPFIRFCLVHPQLLTNEVTKLKAVPASTLFCAIKTQIMCEPSLRPVRVRRRLIAPKFFKPEYRDTLEMHVAHARDRVVPPGTFTFFLPVQHCGNQLVWEVTVLEESPGMTIGMGVPTHQGIRTPLGTLSTDWGLRCTGEMVHSLENNKLPSPYCRPFVKDSCITMSADLLQKTLSFQIDGVDYGVACNLRYLEHLTLAVSMTSPTGCVRIVCKRGMLLHDEVWKSPQECKGPLPEEEDYQDEDQDP